MTSANPYNPEFPFTAHTRVADRELLLAGIVETVWGGRSAGAVAAGRRAQAAAVSEAWQLWHVTLEQWTDFGERQFQEPTPES
jgi:hypothetical protein